MKYILLFSSMALAVVGQIFLKKGILSSSGVFWVCIIKAYQTTMI